MHKDVHTSVGYNSKNMANHFSKKFEVYFIAWENAHDLVFPLF